jgi:hypothetical protein
MRSSHFRLRLAGGELTFCRDIAPLVPSKSAQPFFQSRRKTISKSASRATTRSFRKFAGDGDPERKSVHCASNRNGETMSLFDYPRVNFKGTIQLNPGTANNDDYAQGALLPASLGPFAGQALGLIDSKTVQARTFGMSDADFIEWVQKASIFDRADKTGPTKPIIPAEWNYYGDMKASIASPQTGASIIGVQTAPDKFYTEVSPAVPASEVIGAALSYLGNITDLNSEGSPPATQFFIHSLTLRNASKTFLNGTTTSKGASQWLNFYRNVNLTEDGGAGAYVYHVMRSPAGTTIPLPGFDDPRIIGVICRYYLYRRTGGTSDPAQIEKIYQRKGTNPAILEIVGTFAPLFAGEKIFTGPVGRLLVSDKANIDTSPRTNNNGGGHIALAPSVLRQNGNIISADFSGTFPDCYQSDSSNPKFNFGQVNLMVSNATDSALVGAVDYADTDAGDRRGWIFDFDITSNAHAQKILGDSAATFSLQNVDERGDKRNVLAETDYYFVSNQQAIYAEQNGPGDSFLNQGTSEPATIAVYHRGRELGPAECPSVTVWQYRSVPIQSPGNVEVVATDFKPGQPLRIDTSQPGNFLLTFGIDAPPGYPPKSYNDFMGPPYITNAPSISARILPNDEDFSGYYVNPSDPAPVGNDKLTFDVVYQKVLRTYYLLYPSMNKVFPLNDEGKVAELAGDIVQVTDLKQWMSKSYMPRTRDMSASRRTLLQAWCRKVSPTA